LKTKIAIAGLGWWGKVMVSRLSNSTKVDIVNLIDPVPDEEAVLLSQSKNLKLLNDYNQDDRKRRYRCCNIMYT